MITRKRAKTVGQRFLLGFAFCFVLFNFGATKTNAQGQRTREAAPAQPSQEQILQALLTEVRQLHLSLKRTNFSLFRAQIIVERMRLQQDRVDRLMQQLEELRTEAADNKSNQSRLQDRIKELDSRISQEQNQTLRSQFESEQKEMKSLLEQMGESEERNRGRENQLNIQIQAEQDKLRRLNDRLDAIERDMESQSSPPSTP